MRFWVCTHEHKHGHCIRLLWQNEEPVRSEVIELFPEYEGGVDYESIGHDGPFDTPGSNFTKGLYNASEAMLSALAGAGLGLMEGDAWSKVKEAAEQVRVAMAADPSDST